MTYILTKEQLEERDRKQRELCRIAVKPYLPFDSTGAPTGEGQQAVLFAPSPELPIGVSEEEINAIEEMADKTYTASTAIEFLEWKEKKYGYLFFKNDRWYSTGTGADKTYTSAELYDEFKRDEQEEFKQRAKESKEQYEKAIEENERNRRNNFRYPHH